MPLTILLTLGSFMYCEIFMLITIWVWLNPCLNCGLNTLMMTSLAWSPVNGRVSSINKLNKHDWSPDNFHTTGTFCHFWNGVCTAVMLLEHNFRSYSGNRTFQLYQRGFSDMLMQVELHWFETHNLTSNVKPVKPTLLLLQPVELLFALCIMKSSLYEFLSWCKHSNTYNQFYLLHLTRKVHVLQSTRRHTFTLTNTHSSWLIVHGLVVETHTFSPNLAQAWPEESSCTLFSYTEFGATCGLKLWHQAAAHPPSQSLSFSIYFLLALTQHIKLLYLLHCQLNTVLRNRIYQWY